MNDPTPQEMESAILSSNIPRSNSSSSSIVKEIISKIPNLPISDYIKILEAIGSSYKKTLQKNIELLKGQYKNLDVLSDNDLAKKVINADQVLASFLSSITGCAGDVSGKKLYALAKSIESVMYTKDLNFVGPLNFSEGIVSNNITGSKTDAMLRGATSPAAGYNTIIKWHQLLQGVSTKPPESDIVVVIDNDQTVSKTYRVKLNSKCTSSVIITVCCIEPPVSLNIENRVDLIPQNWASPIQYGKAVASTYIFENFHVYDASCDFLL